MAHDAVGAGEAACQLLPLGRRLWCADACAFIASSLLLPHGPRGGCPMAARAGRYAGQAVARVITRQSSCRRLAAGPRQPQPQATAEQTDSCSAQQCDGDGPPCRAAGARPLTTCSKEQLPPGGTNAGPAAGPAPLPQVWCVCPHSTPPPPSRWARRPTCPRLVPLHGLNCLPAPAFPCRAPATGRRGAPSARSAGRGAARRQ